MKLKNILIILAFSAVTSANAELFDGDTAAGSSIVKIYVTSQHEDFNAPWQGGQPGRGSGSGFIIKGKKILTNAHVVSDARSIQIQKEGDPVKYDAKVLFIAHDCDLAIITTEDDNFYKKTKPLKLADKIPSLNDEVTVVGYPMGGTRVSITKGVVSRIDYSIYSHSGMDMHLVLQVDAAINPGNSGGPVLFKKKVIGVAFQGMTYADNIGYTIPLSVINHFLEDIKDGKYHGYPELGISFLETQNPAMRKKFSLKDDNRGIVVCYMDPFGSAVGHLECGDVLMEIDGYPIANDGTVELNGNNIIFSELMERRQWGESITLKLIRKKKEITVKVPLTNPYDPFIYRMVYDTRIPYFIAGGLVFAPLNRGYLQSMGGDNTDNSLQLRYFSQAAKLADLYKGRDEFVVLQSRLPHPVNAHQEQFVNSVLKEVNGVKVRNLKDLMDAINNSKADHHVLKFEGTDDFMVLDAKASREATAEILRAYGIPSEAGNL